MHSRSYLLGFDFHIDNSDGAIKITDHSADLHGLALCNLAINFKMTLVSHFLAPNDLIWHTVQRCRVPCESLRKNLARRGGLDRNCPLEALLSAETRLP